MESSQRLRALQNDKCTSFRCSNENELTDVLGILQNQPNQSTLKYLQITCTISIDCEKSIVQVLKINKSIVGLLVSLYGIRNSDGIIAIIEPLSNYDNTTLAELDLSFNKIDFTASVAIAQMLKVNKSLTWLNLGVDNLLADGAKPIGDALKENTTLKNLKINNNLLRDVGASAIVDAIKENSSSSLHTLNLCFNFIGPVGAISIATMLMTNKTLIELDISQNPIGKEGAIAIAEALKQNKTLTTLNLDDVHFGDEAARRISTLLSTNFSLKTLLISNCKVRDSGAMAVANALKTNKSLEILSLVSNPISRCVFTNEVAPMLKINTTLKELSVGDHILSIYEVAGVLLEALKSYNDTVYICMHADKGCVATDVIHELAAISVENRSGTRRRKNIFNRLREMWILGSS